jgi:diguanylate cyclase (GGDEF)-like protein
VNIQTQQLEFAADLRRKATLGVALAGVVLLTPFSINNFVQARHAMGAGSMAIVGLLAFNAWSIWRGRPHLLVTLLGLVPAILFFMVMAFQTQGIVGALWCYPAVVSFYFMLPERQAWIANAALLVIAFFQAWNVLEYPLAIRVAATLLAVSTFSALFIRVIIVQQNKLHAQVATDPLTGLLNRVLLRETLERAIQQGSRAKAPMTLLTLDLDHFKSINDTFGHDAGDVVLHAVGELLLKRMRRADTVFRLGGEEFLALLYNTDSDNGRRLAEELRASISAAQLYPGCSVTVSVGVATHQPDEDWRAWMKRSDQNLYRAKSEGRNRVMA